MSRLLFLAHRLPYPPNKGDKVRSYHLIRHLARSHEVFLGTFLDDPDDDQHLGTVRAMCTDMHVAKLSPRLARLRSLVGLASGEALTLAYYGDAGLRTWVQHTCRDQAIETAVIFSSAMAQYVEKLGNLRLLVDFVDVDSAKWTQYADRHRWPMSWLYRREGRRLLSFERHIAERAAHSFFSTENEAGLFRGFAPESAGRVEAVCNGVDAEYFSPIPACPSPFPPAEKAVVFTGAMDYWPNIDAVVWFAGEVLPRLRALWPHLRFHIVGRAPANAVRALAGPGVAVSGTVPDVRPYLMHASVVVAPLRIARGIQNKILEAMSMGRPVVASQACAGALDAEPEGDFVAAGNADDFLKKVDGLLRDPARAARIGATARATVLARYSWDAHLSGIDRYLPATRRHALTASAGAAC